MCEERNLSVAGLFEENKTRSAECGRLFENQRFELNKAGIGTSNFLLLN
jgi:hypothetical protein